MPSEERIPPELYSDILRHVDPRDNKTLLNILVVSRQLSDEAEEVLYRDLRLREPGELYIGVRVIGLAQLINVHNRIGRHVHTFVVEDVPSDLAKAIQLHDVVRSMINLKSLSLKRFIGFNFQTIMPSPPTFQLQIFDVTYPVAEHLTPFLNSQYQLRYLNYFCSDSGQVFDGLVLPSLTRVSTSVSGLLAALLNQKSLRLIHLQQARRSNFGTLPSHPIEHVEVLANIDLREAAFWATRFPNLRLLHGYASPVRHLSLAQFYYSDAFLV